MNDNIRPNAQRLTIWLLVLWAGLTLAGCGRDSPEVIIKSADASIAKNDPVAAAIQYKAALQLDPQAPQVRMKLARALLATSDPIGAIVELNKAREQGQGESDTTPLLAQAMLVMGDAKRIVSQFETVSLADKSAQASLKTSVALAWAQLGNRPKSDAALALALASAPDYGRALVVEAQLAADRREVDAALAMLDKVLQREPRLTEAWFAKGEILAFAKNDLPGGKAAFAEAIKIDPFYVSAYASLANVAVREKNLPAAVAQADALRKLLPTHPNVAFIDAQVAMQQGRMQEARDKIQALLRIGGENVGVLSLAGVLEGMTGSFVIAESHFVKALSIDPKLDASRRSLALTYLNLGQHGRALDTLKSLIETGSTDAAALSLAGEAALRLGDAKLAESFYTRAAKINPSDTFVNTSLAVTQLRRGNTERGLADLQELSRSDQRQTVADLAIISAHFSRAAWPEALKAIDVAVAKTPNDATLLELRGRAQIARGDLAAARATFEQAFALDPKLFTTTANLAAVDLLEKKPDDAARRLQQAMKRDPRNFYAGLALADLRSKAGAPLSELQRILADTISGSPGEAKPRLALIELNLSNKRLREALTTAQDAASALPNDALLLEVLARAQAANGETQQAISTYRRLANMDPKDTRPLMRLADLYRSGGDRKNAELTWRRIAEVNPAFPGVHSRIVDLLISDKSPANALAEAQAMQLRSADSVIGFVYEGVIHLRAKALDKAVAAFDSGVKKHPANPELATRLYQSQLALGRAAEAAKFAETWARSNPTDSEFELEVANSHLVRNDPVAAEKLLRSMVARHGDRPLALNNLAFVLAAQNKPGGVALAERALAQTAENAAMLDTYATALAVEGQVARAIDVQRRAIGLSPEDPALRLRMARLAIQAGNKALARAELDALAARGKDFPLRAEVEKLQKSL